MVSENGFKCAKDFEIFKVSFENDVMELLQKQNMGCSQIARSLKLEKYDPQCYMVHHQLKELANEGKVRKFCNGNQRPKYGLSENITCADLGEVPPADRTQQDQSLDSVTLYIDFEGKAHAEVESVLKDIKKRKKTTKTSTTKALKTLAENATGCPNASNDNSSRRIIIIDDDDESDDNDDFFVHYHSSNDSKNDEEKHVETKDEKNDDKSDAITNDATRNDTFDECSEDDEHSNDDGADDDYTDGDLGENAHVLPEILLAQMWAKETVRNVAKGHINAEWEKVREHYYKYLYDLKGKKEDLSKIKDVTSERFDVITDLYEKEMETEKSSELTTSVSPHFTS